MPSVQARDFPPFIVQAANPDIGSGRWRTYGAYETKDDAAAIEEVLLTSTFSTPDAIPPELAGSTEALEEWFGRTKPTSSAPRTRVVSLIELLMEGPEATHAAIAYLLTGDHDHVLRLGGDIERTRAYARECVRLNIAPPFPFG